MNTVASTMPHCDECDLGSIHYRCPRCLRYGNEYDDAWNELSQIYGGKTVGFRCEHCKRSLEIWYDTEEGVLKVRWAGDFSDINNLLHRIMEASPSMETISVKVYDERNNYLGKAEIPKNRVVAGKPPAILLWLPPGNDTARLFVHDACTSDVYRECPEVVKITDVTPPEPVKRPL